MPLHTYPVLAPCLLPLSSFGASQHIPPGSPSPGPALSPALFQPSPPMLLWFLPSSLPRALVVLQEGDHRWINSIARALQLLNSLYGPFGRAYGIGRCAKVQPCTGKPPGLVRVQLKPHPSTVWPLPRLCWDLPGWQGDPAVLCAPASIEVGQGEPQQHLLLFGVLQSTLCPLQPGPCGTPHPG